MHFNGKNKTEFLEECETLFKNRFKDEEFMNYNSKPQMEPPVVVNDANPQRQHSHNNRGHSGSNYSHRGHHNRYSFKYFL